MGNIRSGGGINWRWSAHHTESIIRGSRLDWIPNPNRFWSCPWSSNGMIVWIYERSKIADFHSKPITAVQSFLEPNEVALATSQIFFFQYLGAAIFIAVGEIIFSNSLRAAIQNNAPSANVDAIIAAGANGFRSFTSDADLPGVLHAYNHAITTTYVSHLFYEKSKTVTHTVVTVSRHRRYLYCFLHQLWDGLGKTSKEEQVGQETQERFWGHHGVES